MVTGKTDNSPKRTLSTTSVLFARARWSNNECYSLDFILGETHLTLLLWLFHLCGCLAAEGDLKNLSYLKAPQ